MKLHSLKALFSKGKGPFVRSGKVQSMDSRDIIEDSMSALTKIVIDKILEGVELEEIAVQNNLTVLEVARTWKDYVTKRTEMPFEEQWLLHLLRLNRLLVKANSILEASTDYNDIESMLRILDRIEALQSLNIARKDAAESAVAILSKQQGMLVMQAMFHLQASFKSMIEDALENKTIKAIKSDLLDNYETVFVQEAQKALESVANDA